MTLRLAEPLGLFMEPELEWRLIEPTSENGPAFARVFTISLMSTKLPTHVASLFSFLTHPESREAAHQHRAHAYFQHVFGDAFKVDEQHSDGYVPGHFVLELKGASTGWYAGLIQGLAYHRTLDFSVIVVAANGFLAMWRVDELPEQLRDAVANEKGAASEIGKRLAAKFKKGASKADPLSPTSIMGKAIWECTSELTSLFADASRTALRFKEFEARLRAQDRVRLKINPTNFPDILADMSQYFSPPLAALRAFYTMIGSWKHGVPLLLSERHIDEATLSTHNTISPAPRSDRFRFIG